MKYKIHIKIDEFEYVELEEDTLEELYRRYSEIKSTFAAKEGLPTKEFNTFLDRMLKKGDEGNHVEDYNRMSRAQQYVVQELKKAIKRVNKEQ